MSKKQKQKNGPAVPGATGPDTVIEDRRARFEARESSSRKGIVGAVVALAVLAAGVAAFVAFKPGGPQRAQTAVASAPAPGAAPGAAAPSAAPEIRVATAELADGRARHYSWTTPQGKEIRFFLLRSSDGVIRAAFDACDVCWPERKGYRQEGDYMVCNNCGQRFASVRINEVRGGCNPAPLDRRVDGDDVVILTADIAAGGDRYF